MEKQYLSQGVVSSYPGKNTKNFDLENYIISVLNKTETCCVKELLLTSSTTSGVAYIANGTVALPSLAFTTDPNTGIYRIGADNIGISAAGAKVVDISTSGLGVVGVLLNGNGTVALPAFSFTSDPDSGWYRIGANNIGASVNGAKVLDIATSGLTVTGLTTTTTLNTGAATFTDINNYKSTTSLTATAGGAQAGTALASELNIFTTVATAGDSAQLPVAVLGKKIKVKNAAAISMNVFGQTGDSIDGAAANAAFAVQPGQEVTFEATSGTTWITPEGTSLGTISSVTQGSSITTGVTVNSKKGIITTFTPSTAALSATTFTVTCNKTTATSNIRAYVTSYGGTVITNGLPYVFVKNQTASGFDIVIYNAHATNALSTSMKIGFEIIN